MAHRDVLIIGGGIAGLTAAVALQQLGMKVRVFERSDKATAAGAGLVLSPNAIHALHGLGLDTQITAAGVAHQGGMQILNGRGERLSASTAGFAYPMVSIHRAELSRILLSALQPDTVHFGRALRSLEESGEGVLARFEDGSEALGDYAVAADGIHSQIRRMCFPQTRLRYAGYTCWRGVADGWPDEVHFRLTEIWSPKGRFGVVPIGGSRTYWYALLNGPAGDGELADYGLAEIKRRFSDFPDVVGETLNRTREGQVIHHDIYDFPPIRSYSAGRILLMGDAAHAMTPNLGQGACQAIEDAYVWQRCIRQSPGFEEAVRSYEKRRCRRAKQIVENSFAMGRLAQLRNPWLCALRDTVMKVTPARLQLGRLRSLYEVEF